MAAVKNLVMGALALATVAPVPMARAEAPLWPLEFADKVREQGGSVTFVFGRGRPFPQCHASTVVEGPDGNPIVAWFGGTEEGDPDVGIWSSSYAEEKWSDPVQVAKINPTEHWNPVLFRDEKDGFHLYFKTDPEIPFWRTFVMESADGKAWGEARELVPGDKGGRGPVRSKPIILSDGAWLAPSSTEHDGWNAFVDRSEDGGKTWTRSADFEIDRTKFEGKGIIQPTLWESEPGKVHAMLRSTCKKILRTDSEDGGKTWSPVYDTGLPNNNSGIDAVRLQDGRLLLVYNVSAGNWSSRTPIDLAVSEDNGKTWKTIAHLDADPDPRSEFSYPAIIQKKNGDVVITYTYQRERMRCWQIPLSAL